MTSAKLGLRSRTQVAAALAVIRASESQDARDHRAARSPCRAGAGTELELGRAAA